jgi:molybdenum-dependent DNA-binding transcriptional regulator ModE
VIDETVAGERPTSELDLTLGCLETFLSIVHHKMNFEKAGTELGVAETSVADRLSRLESWFGRSLVSHGPDRGFSEGADQLTYLSIDVLEEFDKNRLLTNGVYPEEAYRAKQAVSVGDLDVLIAVATNKSRARAAHELGKSQAAISRSIKRLSAALNNGGLFRGRSQLSPRGIEMVRSAEHILQRLNDFKLEGPGYVRKWVPVGDIALEKAKAANNRVLRRRIELNFALDRLGRSKKGSAYLKSRRQEILESLSTCEMFEAILVEAFGSQLKSSAADIDIDEGIGVD